MMVIAFQSSPIFSLPRAPLGFPTVLLRFTSVDAIAFLIRASFALSDREAELEQFAVDVRRTRERVGPAHLANQITDFCLILDRPGRRDRHRQYSRKPLRCHWITVAGLTTTRPLRTCGQTR